jgi:thiamine pyrophosphokinase
LEMTPTSWSITFLDPLSPTSLKKIDEGNKRALIILNQSFSPVLLRRLWTFCSFRCCADGGANRLYDAVGYLQFNENLPVDPRSAYVV